MKINQYRQMMAYLTRPRERFADGGIATPKRGLVDEPGSYAGKIPFTKKQKEIAGAFAKKNGISVNELTGNQRKDIRDGMYTLDSLKQTKSEKNFEAGKVRKLNNLNEFQPINPNTKKVYTENEWLSLKRHQRTKALSLTKDAEGYKQRLKISKRKTYLKNREKIIKNVMDYYYGEGGKQKAAERRDVKYKKGPLKGKAGLLQAENNRLLKYMSVAAEYGNPKFEIYEEKGKFAGVRDTDKNIIYRDHRYKGNKGVSITAHPDYKNTINFAKTAKKFKYDRPDKLLGSYFAKYERVPTYAEMYNFFQRDPRVSERTKIQNPLELHHTATMEKYPTKSYQLALFDKNTGANKIINDYNTPGSDAFKNKALADKRLKDLNIRLKIGGEFLGGGAKTAKGALGAAKTKTTAMFKTELAKNPKLVEEMTSYLKIIGCGTGKSSGGRIGFQDGATCLRKGVDKVNRGLKDGSEMKNFSKLVNTTGAKTAQGVLKALGKLGIAFEAGLIGLESAVRMGMGDTFSESIKKSADYLIPGDQTLSADMDKISRELDPGLAKIYGNVQNYYNKQQKLKSFENQKAELENLNASEFDYLPDASEFDSAIETAKKDLDSSTVTLEEELFSKRALDVASDKSKSKSLISNQRLKATQMGDVGEDISGLNFDLRGIETQPERGTFDNFRQTMSMSQEDLLDVYNDAYFSGNYGDPNTEEAKIKAQTDYNRAVKYIENVQNAPLSENAAEFGLEQTYGFNPLIGSRKVNEPMPYKRQSSYIPSPQQADEQKIFMEEMGRLGAAGGGIAKLAGDRSGKPPESGPTPQGLDYLLKRGRQY